MQSTGGQALAAALVNQAVEALFTLPGVQLDWAFDALYDVRDRLRVYHTRHEQTAAYMADGYARTTGRAGVCMTVPGPGLLNALAGLATAYACSVPVVCIAGQIDSRGIGRGYGLLHEVPKQEAVLESVTKWRARALSPRAIAELLPRAFSEALSGRPQPVALEVPVDVLQASADITPAQSGAAAVAPAQGDPELLQRAADLLRRAERPVIYSGGGVLAAAAWAELRQLAELTGAPVVMSTDGRGALSDRDDLAHTGLTGQALVEAADLVLGVGTRFWYPGRVWHLQPGAAVIRIDADPDEVDRLGPPTVGIVADARCAVADLVERLDGLRPRADRRAELRERKRLALASLDRYQPQADFTRALRAALPDDAITVNDLTQVTFFGTVGLPIYEPRTFIGPGYQGTLGSAFPTALGAQAGAPERTVVAIAGDGGYLYAANELASQRQHGLNVISVVFNDGAFGNVKRTQAEAFGSRLIAAELANPDFVALGRAFGVDAEGVETPTALEGALRSAVAARRPALIEVKVGPMANAWPVIGAAGGIYPVLLPP